MTRAADSTTVVSPGSEGWDDLGRPAEVRCGVGVRPAAAAAANVGAPLRVGIDRGWSRGFCYQEAAQADGEEEAPQAAAQDARAAQEQEVATGLPGLGDPSGRVRGWEAMR